ncbi:MAG: hypothetical protein LR001_06460, partial [Clostridiales bacterium]|nr:hypothetical protein [Clostridiales bacterium]
MALTPRQKQIIAKAQRMKAAGKLPTVTPKRQQEIIDMAMGKKAAPTPPPAKKTAQQIMAEAQKAIEAGRKHIAMGQAEIARRAGKVAPKPVEPQEGDVRINPATKQREILTPEGIWEAVTLEEEKARLGKPLPGVSPLPEVDLEIEPEINVPTVTPDIDPEVKPDIDPKQEAIDLVQQQLEEF